MKRMSVEDSLHDCGEFRLPSQKVHYVVMSAVYYVAILRVWQFSVIIFRKDLTIEVFILPATC